MKKPDLETYRIKVNNFEGPFDLLLHLVQSSKIDIHDLSISDITKQFVEFINCENDINIDLTSEFIFTSSFLLWLKSKILLPCDVEIEEDQIDDRRDFIENIIEYQKYKNVAKILKKKIENEKILIRNDPQSIVNSEDGENWKEVSIVDIMVAFSSIAKEIDTSIFKVVEAERISIDDKINETLEHLIDNDSIMFDSLFQPDYSKYELIITFLALLELIKAKKVYIVQNKLFGKIKIIKKKD